MGSLFQVYNSFHLGAYQVAINEASDLLDLSPSESVEKDCYVYRSYIALGSYQVRLFSRVVFFFRLLDRFSFSVHLSLRVFSEVFRRSFFRVFGRLNERGSREIGRMSVERAFLSFLSLSLSSSLCVDTNRFSRISSLSFTSKKQLVMDEIPDDSPSALQAVKSLATYLANPLDRETQAQKMKDMLEDQAIAQNATVQLMAATIFAKEGEMVEAMRCCSTMLSLELSAFMVNLLISMDRVDAAEKTLAKMVANDDDATLTQLATAWVNVALGGSKVQDAMYVYQELGDKYTWTVKLFNGAATCAMAMGRFEDAEKELLEALQRDSKDPDTLHNLAVCALHLGKPATRFFNQLKTLTPKPGAVGKMEELEKMFDTASEQMASA